MSREDISTESQSFTSNESSVEEPAAGWWASLWLWPAVAIVLAGLAEALDGVVGVVLVCGEALAVAALFAGVLFFERRHRVTVGVVAACTASLVVLLGLALTQKTHRLGTASPRVAATVSSSPSFADWQWQRLSQKAAQRANFRGADLDSANLAGLHLVRKNFNGAQADGASFRGSDLAHASFRGASLEGACLEGADLTGADLTGANFAGADVAGVTVSPQAVKSALVWPSQHSSPAAACQ